MTMTTNVPAPSAEVAPADEVRDRIVKRGGEIDAYIRKLKKSPPTSVEGLLVFVRDTVLEFMKEINSEVVDVREEVLEAVDECWAEVQSGDSDGGFDPEQLVKLSEYVEFCNTLLERTIGVLPESPERTEMARIRALGDECIGILSSQVEDEGDEEPEEDGPQEPDGSPEPAQGGN